MIGRSSLHALLFASALSSVSAFAEGDVLLRGVNVIPMTSEQVLRGRDVLVREGRFAAIEPAGTIEAPAGTETIDATGEYLIPGLVDMHVHLNGGRENQPDMLFLYLANGVTTVLSMAGGSAVLDLRRQVEEGELIGPRIVTTSPIIGNVAAYPKTSEEARRLVERYAEDGYSFIKVYNQIPEEGYWGIVEAAKRLHIPVVGHAVRSVGIEGAIEAGQHIAHMEEFLYGYFQDGLDEARIRPLALQLKKADISVIATLIAYHTILRQLEDIDAMLQTPGVEYLPWILVKHFQRDKNPYLARFDADDLEQWLKPSMTFLQKMTRIFHEEGVPILAGTDAVMEIVVPGFSIHQELEELVDAGLSPYEALEAASVLPAAFLGQEKMGTIEIGKVGDAVLLTANPLEDIAGARRIAGVVVRGRWLPKDEIDTRLKAIEKRAIASRNAD